MRAFISHNTALRYWRLHFPLDGELGAPATVSHAETYARLKPDVLACVPETFRKEGEPIDILVFDMRSKGWSKEIANHVWQTPLPDNAFYRVMDMYVPSPEFVFLQLASKLSIVHLIALGCELCGVYVLQPRESRLLNVPDDAPRRAAPLTNIDSIAAFLTAAKRAKGLIKAWRALKYIIEGSRSPMETTTYMQSCLPPMLGGYGLSRPVLNPYIPLDEEARLISGKGWCEGDICWMDEKLDIEYNGGLHASKAQMRSDAGRVLGLEHMGWTVITVTSLQVFDIDRFEVVAKKAAAHLGQQLNPRILGWTPARIALHNELEAWMEVDVDAITS